jgi:hypothetical protein
LLEGTDDDMVRFEENGLVRVLCKVRQRVADIEPGEVEIEEMVDGTGLPGAVDTAVLEGIGEEKDVGKVPREVADIVVEPLGMHFADLEDIGCIG